MVVMALVSCCFFFQAEDGIRDRDVTGVQTCALPISTFPPAALGLPGRAGDWNSSRHRTNAAGGKVGRHDAFAGSYRHRHKSEERRVGKEWRSRWSPD